MKLIAVPLDGSKNAEAALSRAAQLATALGNRLLLFCVADSASATAFRELASSEDISVAHAAEMYLDQVRNQLPAGADVLTRVSSGNNPPSEIVVLSQDDDVDMIVMARHGRSGTGQWLMGSVTDKIVRASTAPVVVVPV